MGGWQNFQDRLASLRGKPALDALLTHARPDQSLAERVAWAEDLPAWVRRDVPATRLKLLLQMLERRPEARTRVAQTLRSIVRDTQALDLFADTGLPRGVAFTHELLARLVSSVLPDPPDTRDLADIFDRLFPRDSETDWLEQVDGEGSRDIGRNFLTQRTQRLAPTNAEAGFALRPSREPLRPLRLTELQA